MKKDDGVVRSLISKAIGKGSSDLPAVKPLDPSDYESQQEERSFLDILFRTPPEEQMRRQGNLQRIKIEEQTKNKIYEAEAQSAIERANKRKQVVVKAYEVEADEYLELQKKAIKGKAQIDQHQEFYTLVDDVANRNFTEQEKVKLVRNIHEIFYGNGINHQEQEEG